MNANYWIVAIKFGSTSYDRAGMVYFYGEGGAVVKDRVHATRFHGERGEDFALRAAERVLRMGGDVSDAWTERHTAG
jgi:hypothetical protein